LRLDSGSDPTKSRRDLAEIRLEVQPVNLIPRRFHEAPSARGSFALSARQPPTGLSRSDRVHTSDRRQRSNDRPYPVARGSRRDRRRERGDRQQLASPLPSLAPLPGLWIAPRPHDASLSRGCVT
jgi:hypothetical protein